MDHHHNSHNIPPPAVDAAEEDTAADLVRDATSAEFREKHALAETSYRRTGAKSSESTKDLAVGTLQPPPTTTSTTSTRAQVLDTVRAKSEHDAGIARVDGKAQHLQKLDVATGWIPEDTAAPLSTTGTKKKEEEHDHGPFDPTPALPTTSLARGRGVASARDPGAFRVSHNSGNVTPGELFHSDLLQHPPEGSWLEPLTIHPDQVPGGDTQNNKDDDGLAVAEKVLEEGHANLPRAEELAGKGSDEDRKKKYKKAAIKVGVVLGLVMLAVFLTVFFVVRNAADSSSTVSTSANTNSTKPTAPPPTPADILTALLPSYTRLKLEFDDTAQSRAFRFVTEDPLFATYSEKRLVQRFALATFYYATNGENWDEGNTTWLNQSRHECDWETYMPYGRQYVAGPDYRHSRYKFIDTPCFVPNATHPDISINATSTTDDDDITCLAMFERKLTGVLPPELALLTSLKVLQLESTTLEGTIPSLLFDMDHLEELHLTNTLFVDTIPTELTQLTQLRYLQITGEQYYGTLPTELGVMTSMVDFKITDTQINGTLPVEYASMQPKDFQINNNFLSGTIPTEWGLWSQMEWFMLDRNALTGTIPTEMGMMDKTWIFYVHHNDLHGTLPTELGLMTDGEQIYVMNNTLTGTLPTELGAIFNLWRLVTVTNFFTGKIPSEYGQFTRLHNLAIRENAITGTIPTEVANISTMEYLSLSDNQLSGSLPVELAVATGMRSLRLEENLFSGTLPVYFGSMPKVSRFRLDRNNFVGPIPSELGLLTNCNEFNVDGNQLSGTIPAELEFLVTNGTLVNLNLTMNDLTGEVPEGLCVLGNESISLFTSIDFDCDQNLCGCGCLCSNVFNSSN